MNGKGPPQLVNLFTRSHPVRMLRSNDKIKLSVPRSRSKFAENDFTIRGIGYWDQLPADIQHAPSIDAFKSRMNKNPHIFEHIT